MVLQLKEHHLLVYSSFIQSIDSMQHHNRIQGAYRLFASSWLLATFIGMGYSLSSYEVNLPFHPLLLVALICVGSSVGIFLIWYMDLVVGERFIATLAYQGLDLEKQNLWLPQIFHNVVKMRNFSSYVAMKSTFYMGCFTILLCALGSSLTIFFYLLEKPFWMIIPCLSLILIVLMVFVLRFATKKIDPYHRLHSLKENKYV